MSISDSIDGFTARVQMEDVVDVGDGGEDVMLQRQMMSAVWKMVEICYVEDEPGVGAGGAGAAEALVGWLLVGSFTLSLSRSCPIPRRQKGREGPVEPGLVLGLLWPAEL